MSDQIVLNVTTRTDLGKGASRRLRHTGNIPAVVYGSGEPISVTIQHKDIWKAQESESFYASVINLNIDGTDTPVVIKDLQRHPAKPIVMHADFQRADDSIRINMTIPLHFVNTTSCHGVKLEGGSVQIDANTLRLSCVPSKIPSFIEIDLIDAKVGEIIHISDLKLPEGVESVELNLGEDHNLALAQIKAPRAGAEE